jgi:hypothetical protein
LFGRILVGRSPTMTANLFTIAASCVPEAVAAHPPRKLVFFGGNVVARHGSFLPVPVPLASEASA